MYENTVFLHAFSKSCNCCENSLVLFSKIVISVFGEREGKDTPTHALIVWVVVVVGGAVWRV